MLLSQRYKNDGIILVNLNEVQKQAKRGVEEKIKNKIYTFETSICPICNNTSKFLTLAEKDRYGLECTTVICKRCGLLITNPRMTQLSYNEFYDKEYRRLYTSSEISTDSFFRDQYSHGVSIVNFIKEQLNIKNFNDKYVVEVGCGAGGILEAFREERAKVQGLDLGESYLSYGREKYHLSLNFGTIHDFEFEQSPNIIIYSHVLEHILILEKELIRIRQISNENTIVYIEVPGVLNIHNAYGDFLLYLQSAHTYHFSLKSLQNLFSKYGFSLIYGNEYVQAIFKKESANQSDKIQDISLYFRHINYLKRIESNFRKSLLKSKLQKTFPLLYKVTRKLKRSLKKVK